MPLNNIRTSSHDELGVSRILSFFNHTKVFITKKSFNFEMVSTLLLITKKKLKKKKQKPKLRFLSFSPEKKKINL